MLKRSGLKPKKFYTLKKTPLKQGKKTELKKTQLKQDVSILTKTTLKKQNTKAKDKWEEVRNLVLIRDNYKCVVCKKKATQVHHIHLRSKRKDLMYNMNNLVSLCSRDHGHQSTEGLEKVNIRIAKALHMTLKELLQFAETSDE